MADFKHITGTNKNLQQTLAARLQGAVRNIVRNTPVGQTDTVVQSLSRFLSSFGPRAERLMRTSNQVLSEQNNAQAYKMKTLAIAKVQAQSKLGLEGAINKYRDGRIDLTDLKTESQNILRRQSIAAAIIGVGGVGNLTSNVMTAVRRQLTEQFSALDGFITDISSRNLTQRDTNRLALFSTTTHSTAQLAQRQFSYDTLISEGEGLEERRYLGGSDQCEDCIELANQGWQPAGSLPAIGQGTVCGARCRCTLDVRVVSSESATGSKTDSAPVNSG